MGPEPHQNFIRRKISTNMVTRGAESFGTLGEATDTLIE